MRKFFTLLFFFFMVSGLQLIQAQSLQRADELFLEASYPAAIKIYERILDKDNRNPKATVGLARSYFRMSDPRSARRWYARAVKQKGADTELFLEYGQVLMSCRKYPDAIPWFEKYQQSHPGDERAAELISACKNLEDFMQSDELYKVKRLAINSEASEFSPAIRGKSLIFTSSRKNSMRKDNRTGQSYLDMYQAAYNGDLKLGEPELFHKDLTTPFHEATACFSKDGKEMFFTRNQSKKGKAIANQEGVVKLATFRVVEKDGEWGESEMLPFNDPEYSVGHPALSPDGKRLYLVSNMPGGMGATDLYVVEQTDSGWGKMRNLGEDINSKGSEMFPTVGADGTLFFSSDGRGGLGGLDIFQVDADQDIIGAPQNLGAPINSAQDDFGLVMDEETGIGFFSSNRPGSVGADDLYGVIQLSAFYGFVYDSTGAPIEGVKVSAYRGRSRTLAKTDQSGKFLVGLRPGLEYKLNFRKQGFEMKNEYITLQKKQEAAAKRFELIAVEK